MCDAGNRACEIHLPQSRGIGLFASRTQDCLRHDLLFWSVETCGLQFGKNCAHEHLRLHDDVGKLGDAGLVAEVEVAHRRLVVGAGADT